VKPRRPGPLALAVAVLACAGPRATEGERVPAAGPQPPRSPAPPTAAAPAPAVERGSYGREPDAEISAVEEAVLRAAVGRAGASGRAPRRSNALVLAARALARGAAAGAEDPIGADRVRGALAGALSFDYAPVAHLVSAPAGQVASAVAGRISRGDFTHAGAGSAIRGDRVWVVVLLARRPASLRAFPRDVEVGAHATLAGELSGLEAPRIYVTSPAGTSHEVGASARGGRAFSADLRFEERGRYTVEIVGTGGRGPEVAALLVVSCGGAPLAAHGAPEAREPSDGVGAEAAVVAAIDAARRARGLAALEASPALADVARRHSEAMLARGTLAHVLPGSGDPGERLRRARIPYRLVLENVAKGSGALVAHRAAEESPAHLGAILSQEVTQVGCGIARGRSPTGEPIVYVTEMFVAAVPDSADRFTPDERVRRALWDERARAGAPPLLSDPALDALARDAARDMLRAGAPGESSLGEAALRLGRRVSAVDAFVSSSPGDAVQSRNVRDAGLRRVGVGVAQGDSPRYGAGVFWIAVVYTD
jgi:uncharacterized protein YkwD